MSSSSVGIVSPRVVNTLILDDLPSETKLLTTFGTLSRRFTTTFVSRSGREETIVCKTNTDDFIRHIKIQIILKNPGVYRVFRENFLENCYTHLTVCHMLNYFFDNVLRIPDLREEISCHRLRCSNHRSRTSSSGVGIFSYLTGETYSPSSQKKPISLQRAATTESVCFETYGGELGIPSLDRSAHSDHNNDDHCF